MARYVLFVVQQLALLHWLGCCCVELWSQLFPFGNLFMEIFISIGERLKEEREAMGKTQSDFAEIAAAAGVPGATRQSQAKYEKGLASPSAAYLSAIALRGVDVHYVLTGEREGPPPLVLSGEERLLLDYYRDAPAAVRKAAMAALLSGGSGSVSQTNTGGLNIGAVHGGSITKGNVTNTGPVIFHTPPKPRKSGAADSNED